MIKHKPKGWVVMTVTVVWLSLTAAECNEGQPNNTTGSCGYSYASDVFMYVKAPAAYTEFIYNGSNYAFSQPNCVPFSDCLTVNIYHGLLLCRKNGNFG